MSTHASLDQDPSTRDTSCFVVGPIGVAGSATRHHADWLFEEIITPATSRFASIKLERADKINSPGAIDSQIITRLIDRDIVIADLSELNPNAFYELGIRHALVKPTIHMFLDGTELPFDIKLQRAIPFKYSTPEDLRSGRLQLELSLREVLHEGFQEENPVTRSRGIIELSKHQTPKDELLYQEIEEMRRRVLRLESTRTNITGKINIIDQENIYGSILDGNSVVEFQFPLIEHLNRGTQIFRSTYPYHNFRSGIAQNGSGVLLIGQTSRTQSREFFNEMSDLFLKSGLSFTGSPLDF